jgi:hypothetical protein
MRRMQPALLMLAAACASGGSASGPATTGAVQQSIGISTGSAGNTSLTMTHEAETHSHVLTAAPAKVWAMLPQVFDSVGIPAATIDPAQHLVGNSTFKAHGRLKGTPLSRYVDCGSSTQVGPNADSYDLVMSLAAQVLPGPAGASSIAVTLETVGRPATFTQDYIRCTTRGQLENRFIETLQRLLSR